MSNLVPFDQQMQLANAFAKSGLFGVKTADQALALMALCEAEGLHPAKAVQDYDIIQGKPAKKAQAMLASFLANGGKVEWLERTDTKCAATFSHPAGGQITVDWDIERAKMAGLAGKDNWRKFPRAMLHARVISEGVRSVFPGATSGLYTPEEVRDFDAPITNGKQSVTIEHTPASAVASTGLLTADLDALAKAKDMDELKTRFLRAKADHRDDPDALARLIEIKNARKAELETGSVDEFVQEMDAAEERHA